MKIIQITDLHLFAERSGQARGVITWDSFEAVLADVESRHADLDLLVITGDIADDEQHDTYVLLRERLAAHISRTRLLPGNHDNCASLRTVFPEHYAAGTDTLDFVTHLNGWRIVGLDTQLPGEVSGEITPAQVDWLSLQLASGPAPTLLFLHHPPADIGVAWLDKLKLNPNPAFETLLLGQRVDALFAGHVHQANAATYAGVSLHTTPSTCVQFGSGDEKAYTPAGWGYRVLHLDGERLHTEVQRVG